MCFVYRNNHDQAAQVEPNLDNKEDPDESAGTETVDEVCS